MKRAQIVILITMLIVAMACTFAIAQEQTAPVSTQPDAPAQAAPVPETPPGTSSKSAAPPEDYVIQTEDIIRMSVVGEPDLVIEQIVDPKGDINIPLLGTIHAAGLTRKQLTDQVTAGLTKYLVDPSVQLTLSQFRRPKVYVMGMVNRPGMLEFRAGDKIMEAMAMAGSYTQDAYLQGATLTHRGGNEGTRLDLHKLLIENDLSQNVPLQDGDTIYVPENIKNRYFVLGEIGRPGRFDLKDNVTVMDAITNAGGLSPRASAKDIYIIRGDIKKPQKIKVDITRYLKHADITQNIALYAGDVVYVPESNKLDWTKVQGIISTVVNSSYLFRMWGL